MVIKTSGRSTQGKALTPNRAAKPSPQRGAAHGNVPARPKPGPASVKPTKVAGQGNQSGSGGGAKSKLVTTAHGSSMTRKVSPDAVSNIGLSKGNHVTGGGGRETNRPAVPLYAPAQAPCCLGNEVAKNVGRGGPGAGRTVHPSGSQMQHGPVAGTPAPQGRDILSAYGPEMTPKGSKA
jgi:hypothetical protein